MFWKGRSGLQLFTPKPSFFARSPSVEWLWPLVTGKIFRGRTSCHWTSTHPSDSYFLSPAKGRRSGPRPNLRFSLLPKPPCQTPNCRLRETSDVLPKHLPLPLRSSFTQALASLPTTRHLHAQIRHGK
jgi:hypothetical protein